MWHCYINYKNTSADGSTVICDQFHISAKTQQDIINMNHVISDLLDRLGVEYTSRYVFEPCLFE